MYSYRKPSYVITSGGYKKHAGTGKSKIISQLKTDKELQKYMLSNEILFEELALRDKAYKNGKVQLTTGKELSIRLKKRRDVLR